MKKDKNSFSFINGILKDDSGAVLVKYAIGIAAILWFLFVVNLVGLYFGWGANLGPFGDFIGGVANPLLTFLTFICLIKTIFMQRDELSLTREEYAKTKKVLKTQSVESTFYNGVSLHHEIVNNLKVDLNLLGSECNLMNMKRSFSIGEHEFVGRDCFRGLLKLLTSDSPDQETIIERYIKINNHKNEWFGHYFRNLYRIMKIIDDLPEEYVSEVEKKQYCHTLRAQLSSNELTILLLNCYRNVCDSGQFRDLLSRYQILEHLPIKRLEDKNKAIVSDLFEVDYSFLSYFIVSDNDIEVNRKKISLKKFPGGAFGKNHNVFFPKSLRKEGVADNSRQ